MARLRTITETSSADTLALGALLVPGPQPERQTYQGSTGNDKPVGTSTDDEFYMQDGGTDIVRGFAGDDYAYFGGTFDSKDRFIGGDGFDQLGLAGVYQNLTITGAMMDGSESIYFFAGGNYNIVLGADVSPGAGGFWLYGSTGTTTSTISLNASAMSDDILVYSASGSDTYVTGSGNDFFRAQGQGTHIFDGGDGFDRVSLFAIGAGVVFDLRKTSAQAVSPAMTVTVSHVEAVSGTAGADTLTGTNETNVFFTNGGNDTIYGLRGDDTIVAGIGSADPATASLIDGGAGVDIVDFYSNTYNTGPATVSLAATGAQDTGQGTFTLVGIEGVTGTEFNDTLTGNAGTNVLYGADGADTLSGGAGNDTLYGDAFWSVNNDSGTTGAPHIDYNLTASFADTLSGGAGHDTLDGGGGDDSLTGGLDADTLTGGAGNDLFVYAKASESFGGATDRITDFSSGDRIDVSAVDADTATRGDQAFHFGATRGHVGDVVVSYSADTDITKVSFFTDADFKPDMTITLTGQITLTAADFVL